MTMQDRLTASRSYLPSARSVLASYFNVPPDTIREATFAEDTRLATDLVLPNGDSVALRLRKPADIKYADQITIRDSGEVDKLLANVSYYLYGFGVDQFQDWILLEVSDCLFNRPLDYISADASFHVFRVNKACVLASSSNHPLFN